MGFPPSAEQALASLLDQGIDDLDVTISLTQSEPSALARCEAALARLPASWSTRLLHTSALLPAADNFTRCLVQAQGDQFMWLADDDVLGSGFLKAASQQLTEREIVGVTPTISYWDTAGSEIGTEQLEYVGTSTSRQRYFWHSLSANGAFYGLYQRDALLKALPLGRYPAGDLTFVFKLVLQGQVFNLPCHYLFRDWTYRDPMTMVSGSREHGFRLFPNALLPYTVFLRNAQRDILAFARSSCDHEAARLPVDIKGLLQFAVRNEFLFARARLVTRYPALRPAKRRLLGIAPASVARAR